MIQDLLDTYRTKSSKKDNHLGPRGDEDDDSDDAVIDEVTKQIKLFIK